MLHSHSDAKVLMRWQRLPVGTDEATQLIGDVGERHVRRMNRSATSRVLSVTWRPLVSKILFNPFSISATPLMDSPRTATSCASAVQTSPTPAHRPGARVHDDGPIRARAEQPPAQAQPQRFPILN